MHMLGHLLSLEGNELLVLIHDLLLLDVHEVYVTLPLVGHGSINNGAGIHVFLLVLHLQDGSLLELVTMVARTVVDIGSHPFVVVATQGEGDFVLLDSGLDLHLVDKVIVYHVFDVELLSHAEVHLSVLVDFELQHHGNGIVESEALRELVHS